MLVRKLSFAPLGKPWVVLIAHGNLSFPRGWYSTEKAARAAVAAFTRWDRRAL